MQDAIVAAATAFEAQVAVKTIDYHANVARLRTVPTVRTIEMEMI